MNSGRNSNETQLEQGLMNDDQNQEISSVPVNFRSKVIPLIPYAVVVGLVVNFIIEKKYPFESEDTMQRFLSALLVALSVTGATFTAIRAYRGDFPVFFKTPEDTQDSQNLLIGINVTYDSQDYIVKAIKQEEGTYQLGIKVSGTEDDFSVNDDNPIIVKLTDEEAKKITTMSAVLEARNSQNNLNYQVDSLMEDLLSNIPQTNPIHS